MNKYKYNSEQLVKRYIEQYSFPDEACITEEMVIRHWELEKELTKKLLESSVENRWEVFDYCYSKLFSDLDWLHKYVEKKGQLAPEVQYKSYIDQIGTEPKSIYEVGSGQGRLISYLASLGHLCRATEISKERGEKHVATLKNLTWANTDGIHLSKFEPENQYDFVIANAVVEHMHPDDISDHFKGVYYILKADGKYLFYTVHKFRGPVDISRVFGMNKPMGMHLKEYMVIEFFIKLKKAGFKKIYFDKKVYTKKFYKVIPFAKYDIYYVMLAEIFLSIFPRFIRNRLIRNKLIFPLRDIFLIADK